MGVPRVVAGLTVLILLIGVMASPSRAAGLLVPRDGSPPIEVRSHRVTVEVTDGLAKTTLRQTFVNPHSRPLEAIYLFPLPTDAALVDLAMEVGGQRLEGLLAERQQARRVYNQIVRQRRDPALVEQVGRNAFRLSVFPLLPGVDTVVELTWIEHIPLSQGVFRYTYPLLGKGRAATIEQDFTFLLTFRSTVPFQAVTSKLPGMHIIEKTPGEFVASFERSKAKLDQDVTVEGRVEVDKPTLTVETFRGQQGAGWFRAVLTPPRATEHQLVPRDVILVLDTSGSMQGEKIAQARASAHFLLENLRPTDRVNILRFSSTTESFAKSPVPATKENLEKLRAFVDAIAAGGGTALGEALETAMRVPAIEGRVRTVVFLTDGLPTVGEKDPAKLVRIARAGGARGLRVFTFGVGRDVNPALLEGLAAAGRGRAEIFRPEDEVASRLKAFLTRTASPVIADIEMEIDGLDVFDLYPRPVPDAYLGEQVVLLGRYRGGGEKWVNLKAVVGSEQTTLSTLVDFRETAGGPLAVAHLFAREKLDFLEAALRLRSGLDDDAYYASLDRGAYSTEDEIVEEMINVSLDHGVQCSYTSLIALLPEDRNRIDPRNAEELAKAMERAGQAKAALAPEAAPPPEAPAGEDARKAATSTSEHFFGDAGRSGGGSYRGPGGEVPPGQRDPADPQPAPNPPSNPGPVSAGASPRPPTPTGPAGGAIATPGGKVAREAPLDFDHWIFWWAHNKDRFAAELAPPLPVTEETRAAIRPALQQAIGNDQLHPAIRSAALIALARSGGGPGFVDACIDLVKTDPEPSVVDAAILTLGLLKSAPPPAIDFLRAYVEFDQNPTAARCRAALALGLLGDRSEETFVALRTAIERSERRTSLAPCALVALGLIGDEERVAEMIGWLRPGKVGERKLDTLEQAHLIGALGRIGDPRALDPVLGMFRHKSTDLRRSAALALADLYPGAPKSEQTKAMKYLVALGQKDSDQAVRHFLMMSLGRIGANEQVDPETRTRCRNLLRQFFETGGKTVDRPWASLALGLCGGDREAELIFENSKDLRGSNSALGAQAVALGLLEVTDPETLGMLSRVAQARGADSTLRGGAVVALGLIGQESSMTWVREALADRRERGLRADLGFVAGVRRDTAAVPALLAIFDDQRASMSLLTELAAALGRIGAVDAIPPLLRILEPDQANGVYPDWTRVAAAVALGRIASGGADGGLSRLAIDYNYRCSVPVLTDILRIP